MPRFFCLVNYREMDVRWCHGVSALGIWASADVITAQFGGVSDLGGMGFKTPNRFKGIKT
jgi:hypothetical protein